MNDIKTITVDHREKDAEKSYRFKATDGKNYNLKKSQQGWEAFKEEGASFDVETEISEFAGQQGDIIRMTWITSWDKAEPRAAAQTAAVNVARADDKNASIARAVALKCAVDLIGPDQIKGQNFDMAVNEALATARTFEKYLLGDTLDDAVKMATEKLGATEDDPMFGPDE